MYSLKKQKTLKKNFNRLQSKNVKTYYRMSPRRNSKGNFHFSDYPDFQPNLSPKEIFHLGSFGGTYWRPIYSSVTGQNI